MEHIEYGGEGFNNPHVVVDLENHRVKKNQIESKEGLDFLRRSITKLKEEIERKYEEKGNNFSSVFFKGAELLDVDVDQLTNGDLLAFERVMKFKKGKESFDDVFGVLSKHKMFVAEHIAGQQEREPNYNFRKDSRVAFSSWMANKIISEQSRRTVKEKKETKARVADEKEREVLA